MPGIEHVVILGNGVAAWLAALSLRHFSKGRIRVSVLQDPQAAADPELECGPHAMPTLIELHRALAIDEREFMRATAATFKLGTRFVGWGEGSDYFHPFGDTGATLEGIPFHQHWLRVFKNGDDLSQFSLGAVAARQARFLHPSPDPRSILSTLAYGYHFDPALYAGFIRARAEAAGAAAIDGTLSDTALRASDGAIEAFMLEGGNRLCADLFIDCSAEGLLIGRTLQTPFEDWSRWLACDRALSGAHRDEGELAPHSTASATEAGWLWHIPLQHRTERGYAYCSEHLSDERALEALQRMAPADGWTREPRLVRFKNGRRERFWNKNCVALGLAAGFLEPLEGTGLHLIHRAISRLTSLLPASKDMTFESEEFNRLVSCDYERVRDLLIAHYWTAGRHGAFWTSRQTAALPEPLEHKLRVFRSRGRVVLYDEETFGESSWAGVLLGQGVVPEHSDPLAMTLPLDRMTEQLRRMRTMIQQAAQSMPPHAKIIQHHCAAVRT